MPSLPPITKDHPNADRTNRGCGIHAKTFMGDPRINQKQMDAIAKACEADPETLVMGMDENHLPVVRARVGIPRESRAWAIRRNGDPADPGRIFQPFHYGGNPAAA